MKITLMVRTSLKKVNAMPGNSGITRFVSDAGDIGRNWPEIDRLLLASRVLCLSRSDFDNSWQFSHLNSLVCVKLRPTES